MSTTGIIIAAEGEAHAVLADGRYRWKKTADGLWESGSCAARLALSGIGKVYASWAFAQVARDADLVVSLGTSGGLGGEPVGELYLCAEFVEYDMEVEALGFTRGVTPYSAMQGPVITSAGEATLARAGEALGRAGLSARRGRSLSGDRFLTDPAFAASMRDEYAAQLCDMETAACAKLAATRAGREFFALRYVSDNANHDSHVSWTENVRRSSEVFDRFLAAFLGL